MKINIKNTLYAIDTTNKFNKHLKKAFKQGKNIDKLIEIVECLANKMPLDSKYKDHQLIDDKYYKNCRECHITPDWLLVYKCEEDILVLLLIATGSHAEVLNK